MSSLISNVLAGVGKQVLNAFTDDASSSKLSHAEQLQQFDKRLDFAVNPEKAQFKEFLQSNFVDSMEGIEFLSQKVKDGLLSDPELAQFVSRNGGLSADFSIDKRGSNFVLTGSEGQEWVVQANSKLEKQVDQLFRLESIKQLAAITPGVGLDQLVEQAFQPSSSA